MDRLISELVSYGLKYELVHEDDKMYVINNLIEVFGKKDFQWVDTDVRELHEILSDLCDVAVEQGLIEEDTVTYRDLFDTKVMGILTPPPSVIRRIFEEKYR